MDLFKLFKGNLQLWFAAHISSHGNNNLVIILHLEDKGGTSFLSFFGEINTETFMDFLFVCEVALYDTCCCHKSYFHLVVNTTQPFPLLSLFQRIFNWHLKFQVAFNIDASTPCAVLMKLGFYKITLWLIRKSGPWWHFQLFSWKSAKYCGKRRPEEEKVAPNIKYKVFGNKVDKVDCSFCTLHTVLFALHWPKMF